MTLHCIRVYPNDDRGLEEFIAVDTKTAKWLERYMTAGGFLRYDMDTFADIDMFADIDTDIKAVSIGIDGLNFERVSLKEIKEILEGWGCL